MATTRLGQIGVGVEPYGTFSPKDPAPSTGPHNPGLITRLAQFGVGVSKYGTFEPKSAAPEPEPQPTVQSDGAVWPVRGRRRRPEDYERERKMVEEYLEALDKKARPQVPAKATSGAGGAGADRAKLSATSVQEPVASPAPRLTKAMARAAHMHELDLIAQHEAAAAVDRARAEEERRRRQRAAAIAVLMMSH